MLILLFTIVKHKVVMSIWIRGSNLKGMMSELRKGKNWWKFIHEGMQNIIWYLLVDKQNNWSPSSFFH